MSESIEEAEQKAAKIASLKDLLNADDVVAAVAEDNNGIAMAA